MKNIPCMPGAVHTWPLARLQPYLSYVVRGALALDVLAMFFQMLPVPTVLHSIAWAVSLVTSAILIAWALCVMLQRFAMPFTQFQWMAKWTATAAIISTLNQVCKSSQVWRSNRIVTPYSGLRPP